MIQIILLLHVLMTSYFVVSEPTPKLDPAVMKHVLVNNEIYIIQKLGSGSYGSVYAGKSIFSNQDVAVKVENWNTSHAKLELEYAVYKTLNGTVGIPHAYWLGRFGDHRALVLDRLGPSLNVLRRRLHRPLQLGAVASIGEQMVSILRALHNNSYIHRDIKPNNIALGRDADANKVYLIDFGSSKVYRTRVDGRYKHISYKDGGNIVGTVRYASLNAMMGVEQSRRDDLESLGNTLVYLMRGLPWDDIDSSLDSDEADLISTEIRIKTPIARMCKYLPNEISYYFSHVRGLGFYEKPDYEYLISLFVSLRRRLSLNENILEEIAIMD